MLSFLCMWNFRKSEKDWMQKYGTKIKYASKLWFSPICEPQRFFSKSDSVTFVSLWCHNSMKKLEKSNRRYRRYLKTDNGRRHGPTDRVDYIGPLQIKRGLKYKLICKLICKVCFAILAQVLFVKLSLALCLLTYDLLLRENLS